MWRWELNLGPCPFSHEQHSHPWSQLLHAGKNNISPPLEGRQEPSAFLTCKVPIFYMAFFYPFHQFWDPDVILFNYCNLCFKLLVLSSSHIPLEATEAFFMYPSSDESVFNDEVFWEEHTQSAGAGCPDSSCIFLTNKTVGGLRCGRPRFQAWLHHSLTVCPWASQCSSLSVSNWGSRALHSRSSPTSQSFETAPWKGKERRHRNTRKHHLGPTWSVTA